MLSLLRTGLMALITVVLVACGGGGGGDETPNFAGKYLENFNLATNSCNLALPATLNGTDVVTQNGRSVTIDSAGTILTGSVDADNGGFTVSGSQVSSGVTVQSTVKYRTSIAGSTYSLTFNMVTNGTCTIVYTGTATKI